MSIDVQVSKMVLTQTLKPHPRNYREHPRDQLDHIIASIKQHGFYRNVVATSDGTVLAGHGVVEASIELGLKEIPVIELAIEADSTAALKVLTGDNYLAHFSADDDRELTEILKEINDLDDLIGTGFDQQMLANLAMVTRSQSELEDFDAAAEWLGMPEFEPSGMSAAKLILHFDDESVRQELADSLNLVMTNKNQATWSANYPPRPLSDPSSVRFEG